MSDKPTGIDDLSARRLAEGKKSLSLALQREKAARVQQALEALSELFSNSSSK